MDDTKLVPISRENLDQLIAIAAEHRHPRSKRWYTRLLFSDFQKNEQVKCRGFLLKSTTDGVVGCLCLAPIDGWFKNERRTFYRIANFACRKKYGVHALELIAEIMEHAAGNLMFTNSLSNQTSFKCWQFAGFKEGPESGKYQYFLNVGVLGRVLSSKHVFHKVRREMLLSAFLRPFDFVARFILSSRIDYGSCRVLKDFACGGFGEFWHEFLLHNDGVVTSRDPAILHDLFDESLHAGMMVLIAAFSESKVIGYILLRKVRSDISGYSYFRIADWCAIGNDNAVLLMLLRAALKYCILHHGLSLNYIGGNHLAVSILKQLNPVEIAFDHQTFVYHVSDPEMAQTLQDDKGWFFGPYDGDHCLGYGGYVDL